MSAAHTVGELDHHLGFDDPGDRPTGVLWGDNEFVGEVEGRVRVLGATADWYGPRLRRRAAREA